MNLLFWKHKERNREPDDAINIAPHTAVALGPYTYSHLPLEETRNDIYTQGGVYPPGSSDRYKWYNNTFWGNRLPPSDTIIGIHGANAVRQKLFWTQHSPEQKFIKQWQLNKSANYQYKTSVMQTANDLQQMSAAWRAQAGNGV